MAVVDKGFKPVRRGRSSRVAARTGVTSVHGARKLERKVPTYELLDEFQLDKLEGHADWILDEIGVEFRGDEEALELFRGAGARVDGARVRFDPGLAQSLCSTAPRSFAMHGRDR